jgi:hypothetical protein
VDSRRVGSLWFSGNKCEASKIAGFLQTIVFETWCCDVHVMQHESISAIGQKTRAMLFCHEAAAIEDTDLAGLDVMDVSSIRRTLRLG